jgi:DNA-binding transcriptional MerR regulator
MTEYRIDELALRAGTTVRNVRAYQERGLLAPPRRQGRAGLFDDAHLHRLRLIGQLLERGYTLANIGELIDAWEKGHAIDQVLGVDEPIPPRVSVPWLVAAFRAGGTPDPDPDPESGVERPPPVPTEDDLAALRAAFDLGVLDPVAGHAGFRVANPRLLRAVIELALAGVPLAALAEHALALRADVERLARGFVDLVDDHVFAPLGDQLPAPDEAARLSDLVRRLRPLADDVVMGELDRAIDELVRRRLDERLARLLAPPPVPGRAGRRH